MIITLSEQFDRLSAAEWMPYIPAIENILIAHAQGWHMFVPSRAVVATLCTLPQLSDRHRSLLSVQIAQKLAVLAGQAKSVKRTIYCLTDEETPLLEINKHQTHLNVFRDLENCFKSKLIVENGRSDGKFYLNVAKLFVNADFGSTPLAIEVASGGGTTTANLVAEALQDVRPVLTIVDGDRRLPTGKEGDTARQVRAEFEKRQHLTCLLHVTFSKSVENLVPMLKEPKFLEGRLDSIRTYEAVRSQNEAEVDAGIDEQHRSLTYYCFKKGYKIGHLRQATEVFRQNVCSLADRLNANVDVPAHNDNSRDDDTCIPGVNHKYIELFLARLEEDPKFASDLKARFYDSSPNQLVEIVSDIIAFGIAPRRLPFSVNDAA